MIRIEVTKTGKSYSPKDEYRIFAEDTHTFATREELDAWIRDAYGSCKRQPLHRDGMGNAKGSPLRIGWVFGFRDADLSHAPVKHWLQQDWVSVYECTPLVV